MINKNLNKKEKRIAIIRLIIFVIAIILMIWGTIVFLPMVTKLGDEAYRLEFEQKIAQKGFVGVLIVLGLEIMQIVIAVIPGQPMEIIAGMLYGTWGGILLCIGGILIGTAIVFFTVRKAGMDFIELFFSKDKIDEIKNSKIFKNPAKFELLLFIMFVIPVIPKDIFIYVAGLSPVRPKKFLLMATLARIPGLFITVYAGNKLSEGSYIMVGVMIGVLILAGIIGYFVSSKAKVKLENEAGTGNWLEGHRFTSNPSDADIKNWTDSLK